MTKLLVPTDFSSGSKAGIRFAIQWANQQKLELVFVHVLYISRLTHWSDAYFENYAENRKRDCQIKFESFINDIYQQVNANPGKHSLLIIEGISADISILDYCRNNSSIDFICISTRGAGKFEKIFGTHTGNLITHSEVPVLAVPYNYTTGIIKTILYASDLRDIEAEMKRVIAFAQPLNANIEVVHFTRPGEVSFDAKIIEAELKKQVSYDFKLHFAKYDGIHSLTENLQKQILDHNPSLVIMFTDQQRTSFQKIFLPSKSELLSFRLKVPLLVLSKYGNAQVR